MWTRRNGKAAVASPNELLDQARTALERREWATAATAFETVAPLAASSGQADLAWACWDQAGECWRRDDRPRSALPALQAAFDAAQKPQQRVTAQTKLSAVLGDLGRSVESVAGCELAADGVAGPLRGMVLDTWCTGLLALGRLSEVDPLVAELRTMPGPLALAGSYRAAQLCRMRGELDEAEATLQALLVALGDDPRMAPARGAAQAERGELQLMRGEVVEATALLEAAFSHHQDASRGSLMWQAEAARVRTMAEAGLQPLVGRLSEGVAFAERRGMVVLECDLRLARGLAAVDIHASQAGVDLRLAGELAERAGLRARAGRARLAWAQHLAAAGAERDRVLAEAVALLEPLPVWAARAELVALELRVVPITKKPTALIARLSAFGLAPELARARALAEQAGLDTT